MKRSILLISALFFSQFFLSQASKQKQPDKCPPPKFKKGQTSAQVNEDTRNYIACVKQFKEKQAEERRQAAQEAEKRKAEKEAERNRQNQELIKEKKEKEERRQQAAQEAEKRKAEKENERLEKAKQERVQQAAQEEEKRKAEEERQRVQK